MLHAHYCCMLLLGTATYRFIAPVFPLFNAVGSTSPSSDLEKMDEYNLSNTESWSCNIRTTCSKRLLCFHDELWLLFCYFICLSVAIRCLFTYSLCLILCMIFIVLLQFLLCSITIQEKDCHYFGNSNFVQPLEWIWQCSFKCWISVEMNSLSMATAPSEWVMLLCIEYWNFPV